MSRSKRQRIYILLGILVFFCVAAIAVGTYEEHIERIKNSEEILLSIDKDKVSSLSWEYGEGGLSFHKEENWVYEEDAAFPVDETKLEELLSVFESFGASFKIEEPEDEGLYGLDDPICTIKIEEKEEDNTEEYVIKLGDYSIMDEKRYVSVGDGNVYLVEHDPYEDYEITLQDMIQQDQIPELYEIRQLQWEGMEDYSIEYDEDGENTYLAEDVYFTDGKPLDPSLVEEYVSTLRNLNLSDYVSYNSTEEELQAYGLEDPELTVRVSYLTETEDGEEEGSFVLHLGRDPLKLQEAKESGDEDELYDVPAYARVGDSKILYQITSLEYKNLTEVSYDKLRHKEVLQADMDAVTQIMVTLEGNEYLFTADESGEEKVWYYEEEEVSLSNLEYALEALEADSFTKEKSSEKEEIGLEVTLDGEAAPTIRIKLYRYDGEKCLAVVDGEPFAFVSRSEVVELIEAVHEIVLK